MTDGTTNMRVKKNLNFPKAKKLWRACIEKQEIENTEKLSVFTHRFAFAKGFKGLEVDGYSSNAMRGYNALFKVQLAFSAYDSMLRGANKIQHKVKLHKKSHFYSVHNRRLANSLRANTILIDYLIASVDNPLSSDIKKFSKKRTDNVLLIASGIRHLVTHGELTATSVNALRVKNWKQIDKLATVTIEFVDGLFSDYVNQVAEYGS